MILSTPNMESAQARLQWLVRGTPAIFETDEIQRNRHISMLWGKGLEHLLCVAGFTVLERRLLVGFQTGNSIAAVPKRLAYKVIHWLCAGDTVGNSRIYVVAASEKEPRQVGPEDVY